MTSSLLIETYKQGSLINSIETTISIRRTADGQAIADIDFPANDRHSCPPTLSVPVSALPEVGGRKEHVTATGFKDVYIR